MKILITGSHFTPAQAVIEQLQKQDDIKIVYVGRSYTREGDKSISMESQVLPRLGVKFIPIITGRLQRVFSIYTIPSLFKIPIGFFQAFYILGKEKPEVVLSFGGYVAVPVVISAWLLSIPIIIHEQTLISGLANTISSWFADRVAVSFANNVAFSTNKTVLTGNPIRRKMLRVDEGNVGDGLKEMVGLAKKEQMPLVLITGGNQGSHMINEAVGQIAGDLTKNAYVVHQTGESKFNDWQKLFEVKENLKFPQRYLPLKWIGEGDMGFLLREIDLAVSRAGMNTLLELAFFGTPTLVIPIPYLYKDEQNINAKFFEKLGLVRILSQKNLTSKNLLEGVLGMLGELGRLKEKAKEAKGVVIADAAKRLALETLLLGKKED